MNIYYDIDNCPFEFAFFKFDLLKNINLNYINIKKDDVLNIDFYKLYKNLDSAICVFSIYTILKNVDAFQQIIDFLNTKILFICGDEWNNMPVINFKNLIIKQYFHKNNYNYTYLPIGYNKDLMKNINMLDEVPLIKDRFYKWSFIGDIKHYRSKMIDILNEIQPNFHEENIDPENISNIYKNSIFVLCPKGNILYETFRIYEALICGSIPILFGDKQDIINEFSQINNPPFLICESYENSIKLINNLLLNENKLNILIKMLHEWWETEKNVLSYKIKNELFVKNI